MVDLADEYDDAIDNIMLDKLWLTNRSEKGLNCSHTDSPPPLSVAIVSNSLK